METVGGPGSETGSVTKKGRNRRPVSVPVAPQTSRIKRRSTTNKVSSNICNPALGELSRRAGVWQ